MAIADDGEASPPRGADAEASPHPAAAAVEVESGRHLAENKVVAEEDASSKKSLFFRFSEPVQFAFADATEPLGKEGEQFNDDTNDEPIGVCQH